MHPFLHGAKAALRQDSCVAGDQTIQQDTRTNPGEFHRRCGMGRIASGYDIHRASHGKIHQF